MYTEISGNRLTCEWSENALTFKDLKRFVSLIVSLGLFFIAGCTSSYHISEIDDGQPGGMSFEEFANEIHGETLSVLLQDGLTHDAVDLTVTPESTTWRECSDGTLLKVSNDSIISFSRASWVRGVADGLLIGIPLGFVASGLMAKSSTGPNPYIIVSLPAIPAACAIAGGLRAHTFKYRILPKNSHVREH